MLYESNELMLIKNKEPQRNTGSIQCINHRLGVERKLHMDAFERKTKLSSYLHVLPWLPVLYQVKTVFLICPYLLIFKCLQSVHAMVTFCPRFFWTVGSHYDVCQVCSFNLWAVLPAENSGQMKTEWLWCKHLDAREWHFSVSEWVLTAKYGLRFAKPSTGKHFI